MDHHPSSDVLKTEILTQSESEVKDILSRADKAASEVLGEAQIRADRIRSEVLKKAETKADGIRRRILSGVYLEVKRQQLRMRESAVEEILKRVTDRLKAFRTSDAYPDLLTGLIIEGALALEGDSLVLGCGETEQKILTKDRLKIAETRIASETGRDVSLAISEPVVDQGGVLVVADDGRMRFNNRFSARMARMENEMRLEVARVME